MANSRAHIEQELSEVLTYQVPVRRTGCFIYSNEQDAIYKACARGDWKTLKETLENTGLSINSKISLGTPFMIASRHNQQGLVNILLRQPDITPEQTGIINVNQQLQYAVLDNKIELVELLLREPGIDLAQKSYTVSNETALEMAVRDNKMDLVKILLRHPSITLEHKQAALIVAFDIRNGLKNPQYEMVRVLITAGANINSTDCSENMLVLAWVYKNQEVARKLVTEFGASIDVARNASLKYNQDNIPTQIELTIKYMIEMETLRDCKWLGMNMQNICSRLPKVVNLNIATLLFNDMKVMRAFNSGLDLSQTPTPIPRSLLFMGDFDQRMRQFADELIGEQWENEYNRQFPDREKHGYGPGAMVVYNKP